LWEQAYRDLETPAEELKKFLARYRRLGAEHWPRDAHIVELFCGTGNCLVALQQLGFTKLEGVDLSPDLLAQYQGTVQTFVGDCRDLKFEDMSKDVVVIQGGLHHMPEFPEDVDAVLHEVRRVLTPGGRFVLVEPWLTPFLRTVHVACSMRVVRSAWSKLDAVARMNEQEWPTYNRWLTRPSEILELLDAHFATERRTMSWGKLMFVGQRSADSGGNEAVEQRPNEAGAQ
jgi:ubiquinone/menaquinone biosynthesis C-methylase UbiE